MLRQAFAHCAIFLTAASRRSLGRVPVPVWLIILSDQLTIEALVGRYPTNKLMVREPIPGWDVSENTPLWPLPPRGPWSYAVLASLSARYPPPKGTLLTCYSPVRHCTRSPKGRFSFDLHVLSTPLAFVLSQDQTLRRTARCCRAAERTPNPSDLAGSRDVLTPRYRDSSFSA